MFKRWDGVKDGKFYHYGGSLQNSIFRQVYEKPVYWGGGGLSKKVAWTLWKFKRGLGKKERGGVFE